MRLDANESRGTAALGAGRADIGRLLREIDLKCAHGSIIHDISNFATNTYTLLLLLRIHRLLQCLYLHRYIKIPRCFPCCEQRLLSKELNLRRCVIFSRMGTKEFSTG